MARLVHRRTGSVVNVPDEKATSVSLKDLGFVAESGSSTKATAKKTATKKAAAKKSSK
jgi:hypothetical protein